MTILDRDISPCEAPTADIAAAPSKVADRAKPSAHIDDIELLRAIAIIFVLYEHSRTRLFPWMGVEDTWFGGYFGLWDGVDLFFAISGFVIARGLMPKLAAAQNTAQYFNAAIAFWIRRAWRLLPSAWLWIAIVVVASIAFNRSNALESFQANFEGAVAGVLDVANFRVIQIFGEHPGGALFPYWSLSLEEQFYFLLPFVIFWSGRRLPTVLGIAVLLQLFVQRTGPHAGVVALVLNPTKSDALLLGVLIALWSNHPTYRLFDPEFLNGRPWRGLLLFLALVFLLAAIGSSRLIVPLQVGIAAVMSAILVFLASFDKSCFCPDGPLKRILLWFGSRSYAMYVIHVPAFAFAREIWFHLQPPGTVFTDRFEIRFAYTGAILLFSLAELNYRLVEMPLRRHGARIAERISTRPLPACEIGNE